MSSGNRVGRLLVSLVPSGKATRGDRSATFAVASSEEAAVICVRDHGPGIPDAELTRIFRPFYRADSSRRADHEGAGLGLAIAQRAIDLHGGSINVRNVMPHGLQVEIRLPRN